MATGGIPAVEVLKPSAEKTNYIRLARLLMSGGTTIVREVFDSIIPPANLPSKLNEPAVLTRLHQMKKNNLLYSLQWKVLFPSSSTCSKSESFDITLLFKLLREFCGLATPPKGWDDMPDDKDHSLPADLARIKFYRNELCHIKDLGISDGYFNACGKRIKDAFLRIVSTLPSLGPSKDWEKEIDTLLTGPVTEDDERNIEELEYWYLQELETKAMFREILEALKPPSKPEESNCGENLVKFLKEYYSTRERSLVLPFPWMEGDRFQLDNIYTSLTINEKGHKDNIGGENFFSQSEVREKTVVSRILIEGEAGIGKSTYCKKIAYDWSMDNLQIPDVDLVLIIKCCDLQNGDLWQAIKEQNFPEDLHGTEKAEEVFDYIRANQHRILIIVDGFDEIPATAMTQSIKKLVAGQLLPTARVILTSRPERCSDIRKNFDKRLEMTGFSWDESCNFIKHFCSSSQNADETISSLEKNTAMKELIRCPLNAAFLCLILEDKNIEGDFLKSLDIGSLYREMVFCVIKRYCVEKKGKDVQDDTLMDEYHGKMVVLGEIAFNLMKANLTTFGEEKLPDDSKQVLKDIGFLIESKILNTIRPSSTHKFSHSSIKEYFAAFHVAECLRKGNTEILSSIHKFTENPSTPGVWNSNHVQNVYYSLQRFNVAAMAKIPSSEGYIKLINGLAAHLPNDIDVTQAEVIRFDFAFSFICELLGTCQEDQLNEVIKEIAIPDLPVVFYLYNGKQTLDGSVSLLSQSTEGTSKVEIKTLRLEGLHAVSSSIPIEDFINFARALGQHRSLKTVYLSFFSNSTDFVLFFDHFQSTSVENLGLQYIPQENSRDSNIYTILRNLCNLTFLDLTNSSILNDPQFWVPEGESRITHNALRVLKLCHCNLTSRDVDSIFNFLRKITSLEELDMSGNDFSDGISFRAEGCALRVLRMSNCNLGSWDTKCDMFPKLEELDLSGNDFRHGISLDLQYCRVQVLRMSNCNIKELDLSGCDFRDGISLDLKGCTLQVLRMSNCNLRPSFDSFFNVSSLIRSSSTTLEELDLSDNDFSDGISSWVEGSWAALRVLRMSDCNLRASDAENIFPFLCKSTTLEELDLSGNDLSDCIFFWVEGSWAALRVLRMSDCNLRASDAENIFPSLCKSTTLEELDLSDNDFSDGISSWVEGSWAALRVLRMSDCNLRASDAENIFHSLCKSTTLEELDLSDNDFSDGISSWVEGSWAALRVLRMSDCNLRAGDAENIFHSLCKSTTLEELDLSDNDFSDGISFRLEGSWAALRVLRMSDCSLRASDAENIFPSLCKSTTLEELDLSGNNFSDGISFRLEGSWAALRVLWMSDCNLRASDAENIFHSLCKSTTLEELNLSRNNFSDGISVRLGGCALRVLWMSNCKLRSRDAESIFHSLCTSTTLEKMDLSGNDFSDGISFRLDGCAFQELSMRNCKLRSRDAENIFQSLRNSTLEKLDMSGNDFSDGISYRLEGCALRVLRMSNCKIRSRDAESIFHSLRNSTTLEELALSGNAFDDNFKSSLKSHLPKVKIQF